MRPSFSLRLVALLLVPCLLANPAAVSVYAQPFPAASVRAVYSAPFDRSALQLAGLWQRLSWQPQPASHQRVAAEQLSPAIIPTARLEERMPVLYDQIEQLFAIPEQNRSDQQKQQLKNLIIELEFIVLVAVPVQEAPYFEPMVQAVWSAVEAGINPFHMTIDMFQNAIMLWLEARERSEDRLTHHAQSFAALHTKIFRNGIFEPDPDDETFLRIQTHYIDFVRESLPAFYGAYRYKPEDETHALKRLRYTIQLRHGRHNLFALWNSRTVMLMAPAQKDGPTLNEIRQVVKALPTEHRMLVTTRYSRVTAEKMAKSRTWDGVSRLLTRLFIEQTPDKSLSDADRRTEKVFLESVLDDLTVRSNLQKKMRERHLKAQRREPVGITPASETQLQNPPPPTSAYWKKFDAATRSFEKAVQTDRATAEKIQTLHAALPRATPEAAELALVDALNALVLRGWGMGDVRKEALGSLGMVMIILEGKHNGLFAYRGPGRFEAPRVKEFWNALLRLSQKPSPMTQKARVIQAYWELQVTTGRDPRDLIHLLAQRIEMNRHTLLSFFSDPATSPVPGDPNWLTTAIKDLQTRLEKTNGGWTALSLVAWVASPLAMGLRAPEWILTASLLGALVSLLSLGLPVFMMAYYSKGEKVRKMFAKHYRQRRAEKNVSKRLENRQFLNQFRGISSQQPGPPHVLQSAA